MSLVKEQSDFLLDLVTLITYAHDTCGLIVTMGEAYRTIEQQEIYVRTGRSKTMNSYHLKRLAVDLNFFKDGKLTYDRVLLAPVGRFWESLGPKNSWGGNWKNFKDIPHFERRA